MSEEKNKPFPSSEQLYNMFVSLDEKIEGIGKDVKGLETMLRDYNGLHEKIDDHAERISRLESASSTRQQNNQAKRNYVSWIIAGAMAFIALLSFIFGAIK